VSVSDCGGFRLVDVYNGAYMNLYIICTSFPWKRKYDTVIKFLINLFNMLEIVVDHALTVENWVSIGYILFFDQMTNTLNRHYFPSPGPLFYYDSPLAFVQ
jgi:hypothetical protein